MRRLLIAGSSVVTAVFCVTGFVSAALIDRGDGTLSDGNLLWYKNIGDFTGMTYSQQVTAITSLSIAGGGWSMASESDMIQLRNNNTNYDIANNFSPAASDALGWSFYGRYDLVNAGGLDHYGFELYAGLSGHPAPDWQFFWYGTLPGNNSLLDYIPDSSYGAWATKVVPIPGAVWLFGSGLLGLIGIARKSAA